MDLFNFLTSEFRAPVKDVLVATARALNAYADNAGKPKLSYVIQSRSDWLTPADTHDLYEKRVEGKVGSE